MNEHKEYGEKSPSIRRRVIITSDCLCLMAGHSKAILDIMVDIKPSSSTVNQTSTCMSSLSFFVIGLFEFASAVQ
jgi:hypothetical protein